VLWIFFPLLLLCQFHEVSFKSFSSALFLISDPRERRLLSTYSFAMHAKGEVDVDRQIMLNVVFGVVPVVRVNPNLSQQIEGVFELHKGSNLFVWLKPSKIVIKDCS
jgi:hypothetical protein